MYIQFPVEMGSGGVQNSISGGNIYITARNVTNYGIISVDGNNLAAAGSISCASFLLSLHLACLRFDFKYILIKTQAYSGTGILSSTSTFSLHSPNDCTIDGRIALYFNGTGPAV